MNLNNIDQIEIEKLPKQLIRNYNVRIIPDINLPTTNMRMLTSSAIGSCVRVVGTVIRISPLRPLIQVVS